MEKYFVKSVGTLVLKITVLHIDNFLCKVNRPSELDQVNRGHNKSLNMIL